MLRNQTSHTGEGRIRPYHRQIVFLYRTWDLMLIMLSSLAVLRIHGISPSSPYLIGIAVACLSFSILSEAQSLYYSWRGTSLREELLRLWITWGGVLLGLLLIAFLFGSSFSCPRTAILTWFLVTPVALSIFRIGARCILKLLRRRGQNTRALAIAGAGVLGRQIAEAIFGSPWMGYRLVAFFDDLKEKGVQVMAERDLRVIGSLDELVDLTLQRKFDVVYVTLPMRAESRIREIVNRLADSNAIVYLVPDLFFFELMHGRWVNFAGMPTLSVFENPLCGRACWVKRLTDIALSCTVLIFMAIPMLGIALGVKLSSPGPVLFKQRRYGLDEREIVIWKFRTMKQCKDGEDPDGGRLASADPGRITRFGGFLRRTSLDELPQFINVLQGRMSIVGPRPHVVMQNEYFRGLIQGYRLRHRVKPGLTGWAQVNGLRGEAATLETMEERIACDLHYVRNWSLSLDFKILFLTLVRGAWRQRT